MVGHRLLPTASKTSHFAGVDTLGGNCNSWRSFKAVPAEPQKMYMLLLECITLMCESRASGVLPSVMRADQVRVSIGYDTQGYDVPIIQHIHIGESSSRPARFVVYVDQNILSIIHSILVDYRNVKRSLLLFIALDHSSSLTTV
jgi:hypothetical protein